jgi:hypothetical protein
VEPCGSGSATTTRSRRSTACWRPWRTYRDSEGPPRVPSVELPLQTRGSPYAHPDLGR